MKNNLYGISGKINSGKDLVGEILQCLSCGFTTEETLTYINEDIKYGVSSYKIKKYADKLKDIVCLLIGCTREDLGKNYKMVFC